MSVEIDHSGMGAAFLRSHPGTPLWHALGQSCETCAARSATPPADQIAALAEVMDAVLRSQDRGSCIFRERVEGLPEILEVALGYSVIARARVLAAIDAAVKP